MAYPRKKKSSRYSKRRLGHYTRRTPLSRVVRRVAYGIPERKYATFGPYNLATGLDDNTSMSVSSTLYMFSMLNSIVVGTDVMNRIGRQIYVRYIQISFIVAGDGDYLTNGATCRYMFIHDKAHARGGIPTSTTILNGGADGSGANVSALRNSDYLSRFSVKLDRMHNIAQLSQGTAGTTYTPKGYTTITIPINRKINYETSGVNILGNANLIKDDYYFGVIPSISNCCIARAFWRVCFNDA